MIRRASRSRSPSSTRFSRTEVTPIAVETDDTDHQVVSLDAFRRRPPAKD